LFTNRSKFWIKLWRGSTLGQRSPKQEKTYGTPISDSMQNFIKIGLGVFQISLTKNTVTDKQ